MIPSTKRGPLVGVIAVLGLVLTLAGCGGGPGQAAPAEPAIVVFAAASLTDAFKELGAAFTGQTGIPVTFNFAGSQQLRGQLEQGAAADVFASANVKEMEGALGSGLVQAGAARVFARNRLIVIRPRANRVQVTSLADLGRPGVKLVLADKAVPVGQYALDMLDKLAQDATYGPDFKARVLANVVSYEQNVKAVVSKVQLGEADAGVVYATDAAAAGERLTTVAVPDAYNQVARYPIALLSKSQQAASASKFVAFVLSEAGQRILAQHGFVGAPAQ